MYEQAGTYKRKRHIKSFFGGSLVTVAERRETKELQDRSRRRKGMEAVNVMGCHGSSTLDSNNQEDLVYAITKEEAKARVVVEDHAVKDSTETELNKIGLVRALVETRDPSSKEEDDSMIRRFLRARDLDVEKASAMFLKYLKWRRSFVPNGSISLSQVPNELAQDKVFVQGRDKIGRPIFIVFGRKHFQNKDGLDEFKRFVVYFLDKLCASMPPGQEKFVGIAELKGWGYSNSDVRGYISALSILQITCGPVILDRLIKDQKDYYPERLGKLFIVHAPYIFMKVWKIIYPFIDNKTKKKIVFVDNNKLKSTLLEEIEESQLPEIYGGQMQLVPIQDS